VPAVSISNRERGWTRRTTPTRWRRRFAQRFAAIPRGGMPDGGGLVGGADGDGCSEGPAAGDCGATAMAATKAALAAVRVQP
jgi:hypothetical protein